MRCPDFEGIENENYSPMIVLYSPKNFRRGARRSAFSLFVAVGLVTSSVAQTDSPAFGFPPGVDWNSATPEQMVQSVFDAAKNNPDAAADVAAAGVLAAAQTGRWPREGSQDGKQTTDPDGIGGDPLVCGEKRIPVQTAWFLLGFFFVFPQAICLSPRYGKTHDPCFGHGARKAR